IAPAARAGEEMAEHVAPADLESALARKLAALTVGIQHIVRRRARPAAREPVGQVLPAVRAGLERARGLHAAVLPPHRAATPSPARAPGIGRVAVALEEERVLRLDPLDGIVGEVDHAGAAGVHAVLGGPPTPRAEEELEEHEGPPLPIVAAEADAGVAADL